MSTEILGSMNSSGGVMSDSPDSRFLVDLRRVLTEYFDGEELRTLCFDLGVDYDSLARRQKS